jgi:hypothetical protein
MDTRVFRWLWTRWGRHGPRGLRSVTVVWTRGMRTASDFAVETTFIFCGRLDGRTRLSSPASPRPFACGPGHQSRSGTAGRLQECRYSRKREHQDIILGELLVGIVLMTPSSLRGRALAQTPSVENAVPSKRRMSILSPAAVRLVSDSLIRSGYFQHRLVTTSFVLASA